MEPKSCRIRQNITKMESDTRRCHQKNVGYIIQVAQGSHLQQKCTYLQRFLRSSLGGMGRIKGERSERQSDKTENHHQNRLYLSLFDVEKVSFFIKNVLWLYSELCFLCRRGAHFRKKYEKKNGRKLKNGAEKPQMAHVKGICAGLVGPKSENVEKALVLLLLFEGSKRPRVFYRRAPRVQSGPFRRRKSDTFD